MQIKIFTAGGTIDKVYSDKKGTLNFSFGKPAVKEILEEKIKHNLEFDIEPLIAKDSLEMTDKDRRIIKQACEKTKFSKILITHGTDTIVKTARALKDIKNKTIIITGAAQPYKFRESDAEFNLGVAIGALNVLDGGVYIAMSGRIYPWNKCQKKNDGRFV